MSRAEMLLRYARMARIAGTEVEMLASGDLPGRLASLLPELAELCGPAGNPGAYPPEAPAPQSARVAALPASNWPPGLLESVSASLAALDYRITAPHAVPEGFAWDRDSIAEASVGITFCETFLADTGSLVLPAGRGMGTLAALLPDVHVAISFADGCMQNLAHYLRETGRSFPSRLTLVSGPSRTGDIEATMTAGVHGPRRVLHLILDAAEVHA